MRRFCTGFAMALGLAVIGFPAAGLEIGTEAGYFVHTTIFPGADLDDQDGPSTANSGSLNSHLEFGDDFYYSGEAYFASDGTADASATDSGNLNAAAQLTQEDELYMETMEFHATSSWSEVYTNASGDTLHYDFDFLFSGGTLALGGYGGNAMFSLDILLDGTSIWSRNATLQGDAHDIADILANGFDADGLVYSLVSDPGNNYVEVRFDAFSGNLDLGAFGNGDSFELTYNLSVWASSTNGFSTVEATAGDPFGVGFQGTLNSNSAPIPEPASLALLGMGLVGLGVRRLRQRR